MSFHSGHMPEEAEEMDPKAKKTSSPRFLTWFVGAIFAGLGGYYLWMQHRAFCRDVRIPADNLSAHVMARK